MNANDPLGRAMIAVGASLAARSGDPDQLLAELPFLADYLEADVRQPPLAPAPDHPLARLSAAGVSPLARDLLVAIGMVEEDPRLVHVLGAGSDRPAFGQLVGLFRSSGDARSALMDLIEVGLVTCADQALPRALWPLAVPVALWDAIGGGAPRGGGLRLIPREQLIALSDYLAPDGLLPTLARLPRRLRSVALLTIRGAAGNGRSTLAGAVAHALGLGLLHVDSEWAGDASRWALAGAVATACGAMPMLTLDLAPGEERTIPSSGLWQGPVTVAVGRVGAVRAAASGMAITIDLPQPDEAVRLRHWRAAMPAADAEALRGLAKACRLTGGAIRWAAAAGGGDAPNEAEVREAVRPGAAPRLETIAARLGRSTQQLLLDQETRRAFDLLLQRCRHAEALAQAADNAVGVRALLVGPSGTGKTLAARTLAAALGRDLWRIDLSAVVSKWIGETEKNLERAFSAAEDHDAILLFDEGDALMARRTDVGSANDRYANIETSYLLQRIERFEGVLLVTTNALDRIDSAFARRMDIVIRFPPPDEMARHAILLQHLGPCDVSDALLAEVAVRCALSGGQLRNVALAARIQALAAGAPPGDAELRSAVEQEYRKTNQPCPLKPMIAAMAS
jgi:hypothetical protein